MRELQLILSLFLQHSCRTVKLQPTSTRQLYRHHRTTMAQGLFTMLDQQHVDYDTYASSLGFTDEYCSPTSDITELENNIISAARSAEAYNTPAQKSAQKPSQKPAHKQSQKQSKSEKTLSMPSLDDCSVAKKKRSLKRRQTNVDPQTLSSITSSFKQHTDDTDENNNTKATDMCGVEYSANAAFGQINSGENHSTNSTKSTNSSEADGTTLQPSTFEENKLKMDNCKNMLETVSMFAKTADKSLRKPSDVYAKELKAMLEHYKTCMQSSCCHFCKKSPKTNPLRVKSVKCGHSFSCLTCFVTYLSAANGQFQCARCGQLSPIIIE